jgi:hypothetical protein
MVTKSSVPANITVKHQKPATEPRFKVVVDGNVEKPHFTSPTAWHSYDKAMQLYKRGANVDVLVWDEIAGKHVPTSNAAGYDKLNEHGEVMGNWMQVVQGRTERQTGRTAKKSIAIDEETVRILNNLATIAKSSATAVKSGKMSNADLYKLSAMFGLAMDHLDQKIDNDDPDLQEIGPISL